MAEEPQANNASLREMVETAFAKIKELGSGEEPSRIFPSGIATLDLDVSYGDEGEARHVRLTISAVPPAPSSGGEPQAGDDWEADEDFRVLFNAEGHHVIALLAQKDLAARAPQTLQKMMAVLDAADRTLIEAATFPDDIRNTHPETKPFHFVDIPFKANGPANPAVPAAPHVLSKIDDFTALLQGGTGNDQDKADAVSWLIHLFGDVHQPLHCITHITTQHPAPSGDRGGNSFKLKGTPNNLHSLWDSSVSVLRNISETDLANEIFQQHSRASLHAELLVTDTEKWARSSFALAKVSAYGPLTENAAKPPKPTKAYLIKMEGIGQKQAALAGYRLADRMIQLFP